VTKVKVLHAGLPIIILSERGSISQAVEAVQLGASDYVEKADAVGELCAAVDHILLTEPKPPTGAPNDGEVRKKIQTLEMELRRLIKTCYDHEFAEGHESRIRKYLDDREANAAEGRLKSWRADNARTATATTLLDFTYLDQLRQMINREWRLFNDRLPDKQQFNLQMETIVKIRNSLAHSREVSELDLRKADVFCDELIRTMGQE